MTVNIPNSCCASPRTTAPSIRRASSSASRRADAVLSNEMQTVVFGPYWYVPASIKVDEIRPYLREEASWFFRSSRWNTSVLQRHGLGVRYAGRDIDPDSIDWNRVDIRNLQTLPAARARQRARPSEVRVPQQATFTCDTQQKNLFAYPIRAESHGCMRVQIPGIGRDHHEAGPGLERRARLRRSRRATTSRCR